MLTLTFRYCFKYCISEAILSLSLPLRAVSDPRAAPLRACVHTGPKLSDRLQTRSDITELFVMSVVSAAEKQ